MSASPPDLDDLRRRIDEIDDRLQDLLIERFETVLHIGAEKRTGSVAPHQPAREAEIIRRLVARNRPPLQPETLVRIWRELLCGTTRLQGAFRVAVYVPAEAPGIWDIARDHYGSHATMQAFPSAGAVIRSVTDAQAEIGVLPTPQEEEPDPWWRLLVSADGHTPRVIARLPFGARGNARSDAAGALAIGRGMQQATGADRTFFAAESAADVSRARLFGLLASSDLACTFFACWEHAEGAINLIEVDGFMRLSDARLAGFRAQLGAALYRLLPLGGYALPLSAAALSAGSAKV
jgi:chorismate mutase/prephenate dehydratase